MDKQVLQMKRFLHLVTALSLLLFPERVLYSQGTKPEEPQLFSFSRNQYHGFINNKGRVVIPPVFCSVSEFSNGHAAVSLGCQSELFFVNFSGKIAFSRLFRAARPFYKGFARVTHEEGFHYVIDSRGKHIERVGDAHVLGSGRFARQVPFKTLEYFEYDYLGMGGKRLFRRKWYTNSQIGEHTFSEGLMPFPKKQGTRRLLYGFLDRNGRVRIAPRCHGVTAFSEGLAMCRVFKGYVTVVRGRRADRVPSFDAGFINRRGKYVVAPRYQDAGGFHHGRARVFVRGSGGGGRGKWGYIDKKGKLVIPDRFDEAADFSEGVAAVRGSRKGYRFIDRQGKAIMSRFFFTAKPFRNGLAYVAYRDQGGNHVHGFIMKNGKFAWEEKRETAGVTFIKKLPADRKSQQYLGYLKRTIAGIKAEAKKKKLAEEKAKAVKLAKERERQKQTIIKIAESDFIKNGYANKSIGHLTRRVTRTLLGQMTFGISDRGSYYEIRWCGKDDYCHEVQIVAASKKIRKRATIHLVR